jgi:RNA polymerase sigma-70 factor, ECF subfamily
MVDMRPEVSFSFPSAVADEGPTLAVNEALKAGDSGVVEVDAARLSAMLHRHYTSVWRAVRRFGVPSDAAEDATQEVFIVASRKLATILEGQELRYLYGIAMRVAANRRRSVAARREVVDQDMVHAAVSQAPGADALLEQRRLRRLLDLALDELPHDLRTTLVLFELEGFSEREIAETCAVPIGTVASRLRRARQAFHKAALRLRADLEKSP